MSQIRKVHVPVEPEALIEPEAPVQVAESTEVESVNSSGTEVDSGDEMVTRKMMTIGSPTATGTQRQRPNSSSTSSF